MKRISILLLILLTCLTAATAWAGSRIVYVPRPNGTDDTANIQAALDTCAAYGKNCTVQLAAGTYFTKQLVEYNFQGTFKGLGVDTTTIAALTLPVNFFFDVTNWCQPNTTTCLWPTLMIFVDGDISISDLSVHMTNTEGTATDPPGQIETGIRLMGRHTTNVHIDRVEEEGRPDGTSPYGFNVTNGIMYTGELNSSPAPLNSPCGAAGGLYFLSGSYTVRNSSFKMMAVGASQDGCVRSSRVTIGGSPSTGNTFENLDVGIDLESAESSNFEISYNTSSGIGNSMWVISWDSSLFQPSKPSRYLIHDNKFFTTGTSSIVGDVAGILLYNDTPNNPWIDAVIWNNSIQLQNTLSDGIDAVNTKGTAIWNNTVTGSDGYDAIGLWNSSKDTVVGNNVSGFSVDPTGYAQIYLDPSTSYDLVVCAERSDTVLNQGTNNVVIGCQQLDPAAKSISPSDSKRSLGLPKGEPWLRHP